MAMKLRLTGIAVGAIIVALIAFLVQRLRPLELCCITVSGIPDLQSPAALLAAQKEVVEHSRRGGFPRPHILRLLAAGRTYGPRVYGEDGRTDVGADTTRVDPKVRANMAATALVINSSHLTHDQEKRQWMLETVTFREEGACSCERFNNQKCVYRDAACTGFLLDRRHVITASHCITERRLLGLRRFVFGFYDLQEGEGTVAFPEAYVTQGRDIIYRSDPCDARDPDFVIVRLENEIPILPSTRSTERLEEDDPVYVIGYPIGLPAKYAPGAEVRRNDAQAAHFVANIDGYEGNSGSPVFNNDHEVVGIHVRGVLAMADPCGCWTSTWCPEKGCKGEDITRIEFVPDPKSLYKSDTGDAFELEKPLKHKTNKCNGKTMNDHRPGDFALHLARKYNTPLVK